MKNVDKIIAMYVSAKITIDTFEMPKDSVSSPAVVAAIMSNRSNARMGCKRCGGTNHTNDADCYVFRRGLSCLYCSKISHLARVCLSPKKKH